MTPVKFKGIYEFSFGGILLGRMGVELEQDADHYSLTGDIMSAGLANLFVRHTSHTEVQGSGHGFIYPQVHYESHYQTRKKKHYVRLVSRNGEIHEEEQKPPRRKDDIPVPQSMKKDTSDPLSLLIHIRRGVFEARKAGKPGFSLHMYDGNRLTGVDVTMEGEKTLAYGSGQVNVVQVGLRRKPLAGYSPSELAEYDPQEPTLHGWLSDDGRLMPIRLQTSFLMTPLVARLVKECRTGESCLLGLKE
ncbi:MAG: DUF3108 domain-containing protein [Pseudomonadota bacterium]|nr:DUF3108 domain-containing protein [Pseudomonadota bacterium]